MCPPQWTRQKRKGDQTSQENKFYVDRTEHASTLPLHYSCSKSGDPHSMSRTHEVEFSFLSWISLRFRFGPSPVLLHISIHTQDRSLLSCIATVLRHLFLPLLLQCNLGQCFLRALLELVDPLLHISFQIPVWVLWSYVSERVLQMIT